MRDLIRFNYEITPGSTQTVATVPSSHSYFLKSMMVSSYGTFDCYVSVYVTHSSVDYYLEEGIIVLPDQVLVLDLNVTLEAGDALKVKNTFSSGDLAAVTVGGYDYS